MGSVPSPTYLQCPSCGAGVQPGATSCPACGAPLALGTDPGRVNEGELRELVENADQTLAKAATGAAETAFGISCTLGALLIGLVLLAVYFIATHNWIILALIAMVGVLISVMISANLATRAKNATIEGVYRRDVRPKIERYLANQPLTRQEFDALAGELLPEDAPLARFIERPLLPKNELLEA